MKKVKDPIKPSSIWCCPACDEKGELTHTEMMEHLRTIHKIETKGLKAKRSMLQHIDCADSFHSTWEWTIGDLRILNWTSNPRHKDDPMGHG